MKTISPQDAAKLIKDGAILVDVRETDERAREFIPDAAHHPLSKLEAAGPARSDAKAVIFHCRSGMRTQSNAAALGNASQCEAYILEGGIEAWKKAGLPVKTDAKAPIEIMRQVQITAGGLVLLGAALGVAVHPGFYALSAFVGAGLMFAGLSGTCMMAQILSVMPWNRRANLA
nr:rhodanese family protein [Euryhalocaulis sp.]